MARKAASVRGRARVAKNDTGRDGLVARALERAFENPATSGGLLVMALTAGAIVSNALLLQGYSHPDPFFVDREAAMPTGAISPAVASLPNASAPRQPVVVVDPPLPHLAPRHTRQPVLPAAADPVAELAGVEPEQPAMAVEAAPVPRETALITDIQRELARIGLYNGAIDGVAGERTSAAIRAFEAAAGIAENGTPSPEILAALQAPLPPRQTQSIAVATRDSAAEELNRRERERAALIATQEQRLAEARDREAYLAIQTALNRIGYGPLPVDGTAGAGTLDAIRRFELDNGLPVTGQAGDALIARLIAIGAIRPG